MDNRLSWLLGRLEKKFGEEAYYVHLTRNSSDTAKSYAKRNFGIMQAYQGTGIIMHCKEENQLKIARDYIDTVNSNIENFLLNKKNKMNFKLEDFEDHFYQFFSEIGAEGDFEGALVEFKIMYNASI